MAIAHGLGAKGTSHEPAPKSGDESPHSRRFATSDMPWSGAKPLECVRFSGAFWFMTTPQIGKNSTNPMKSLPTLVTLAATLVATLPAFGADAPTSPWPRFRGPNGSGVADDQTPPVRFGPDQNLKWKTPVPSGLSSPIAAGELLVITALDDGKLFTVAYRRSDGVESWRQQAPATRLEPYSKSEGSPAASTPATDGTRIVSYFGSCGLFCYDLTGRELWKHELPPVSLSGDFGSGVSPIIADGLVILVRDESRNPKILAVDVTNGSVKWEQPRQSKISYSTPVVWDTPGGKQIAIAGHARLVGYDLRHGSEQWFVNGIPSACCASPVVANGNLFFAGWSPGGPDDTEMQMPTFDGLLKDLDADKDGALARAEAEKVFEGFFDSQDTNKDGRITRDEWDAILKFMTEGKNAAFALKPGGSGDVTESHVAWRRTKGLPYVTTAILYRDQYVMVKDGGIVTAYDAKTGKELFQERIAAAGKYYASPVAANGHIYFTSLEDGTVTVLKAGASEPEVTATNPKLGERTVATPAMADNSLYFRTAKHLYAFGPGDTK